MTLLGHVGPHAESAAQGVVHMLTEPDHLLAILAVVAVGALVTWRMLAGQRRRRAQQAGALPGDDR